MFPMVILAANTPTDAQIVKILSTDIKSEILEAELAKEKTHVRDVKNFADSMIKDDSKTNIDLVSLEKNLSLIQEENESSNEVEKNTTDSIAKLNQLNGNEFDKTYIEMQIRDRQRVLDHLDNKLIPSTKNVKLKNMLEKTRIEVAKHL